MSYSSYKAGIERQRARLKAVLEHANALRLKAQVPSRDVEAELAQQCPLMTETVWTAQRRDQEAFARFRRRQLAGVVMPSSPAGADWQQVRALSLRRAFLEHQIERAWLARGNPYQA